MKRVGLIIFTILMIVSLSACGSKKSESTNAAMPAYGAKQDKAAETADSSKPAEAPMAPVPASEEQKKQETIADSSRKIIYTADTSVSVKDLEGSHNSIIAKTKEIGGYVSESNIRENYSHITVRIPAGKLEDFLKYMDTLGGENKETSIHTNDITEQYTDTESRLRNLKAHENQLLEIMKKAETVEDTLKIHNELFRIRGDIESYEGRINMWDKLVALSTVTIRLNKIQEIGGKEVKVSFVSFDEIFKGMSNGFKSTLNFVIRFISGIFIVLVSIIPALPFIGLAAWLVIRFRKKKMNNKNIGQ